MGTVSSSISSCVAVCLNKRMNNHSIKQVSNATSLDRNETIVEYYGNGTGLIDWKHGFVVFRTNTGKAYKCHIYGEVNAGDKPKGNESQTSILKALIEETNWEPSKNKETPMKVY
jgi:hypothetical protein